MSTEQCLHELDAVNHKCVDIQQEQRYIPRKDLFTSYIQTLIKKKQIMDYLTSVDYTPKGDAVIVRACIKDPNFTCGLRDEFKVVVNFFDIDTVEGNMTAGEYANRVKEQKIYSCNVSNFKHPFFTFPLAAGTVCEADLKTDKAKHLLQRILTHFWSTPSLSVPFTVLEDCGAMTLRDYFKDNIPPALPDSITPNHHAAVLQMVLALKYLAEKKIVHGDMHWDNVLYPSYSDLQHNDDFKDDSQLEILINDTQSIKTSRVIKIFDWDLSWDSDGLGAMRKDLIGARDFSNLDEIYDKVGFLRSLLKHGYFVKTVHYDEEILAILEDTEYKTEISTTLDKMDDEKMLRLTHLEFILSSDRPGSSDPLQRNFKIKNINKNAENNYTATVFNEFIRGDLQITFQGGENGFSISSIDGLKKVNTLYHCVYYDSAALRWKNGTFHFTNRTTFNHVYPQISDMSKIKTIPEGASWKKSAEFYVLKINSAVDIVYEYALEKFR
jgi:serine/threonine protein kinase